MGNFRSLFHIVYSNLHAPISKVLLNRTKTCANVFGAEMETVDVSTIVWTTACPWSLISILRALLFADRLVVNCSLALN